MSTTGDADEKEGGEGPDPGFVRPRHKEDGREDRQEGRVALFLYMASHSPMSAEGAMTLASAVAYELYSLLMRPSAMGMVAGSHRASGSPHAAADYEERISDQEEKRAR
jgi:hypothetical protein